ncbi:MAG: YlbF family regulator [Verrucomicrobiota bacterium]
MSLIQDESPVMQKTRELCATLADHPSFASIRQRMDAFMADDKARAEYEEVHMMGQALQEKQSNGVELTPEEIAKFEAQRDSFISNPVAKGFLDAQEEMNEVRSTVVRYVMKTFEVGRQPEADDFHQCGSGCNCG